MSLENWARAKPPLSWETLGEHPGEIGLKMETRYRQRAMEETLP